MFIVKQTLDGKVVCEKERSTLEVARDLYLALQMKALTEGYDDDEINPNGKVMDFTIEEDGKVIQTNTMVELSAESLALQEEINDQADILYNSYDH